MSKIKRYNYEIITILSYMVAAVYFFNPTLVKDAYLIIPIVCVWFLIMLISRTKSLEEKLLELMILSIPLSFISIFGSTDSLVFFNWFMIFSLSFFALLFIKLAVNYRGIKFDFLSGVIIVSEIALLVTFFANRIWIRSLTINQLIMISIFLISFLITRLWMNNTYNKTAYSLDDKYRLYFWMTIGMAVSIIIQYVAYKNGEVIIGRVERFGLTRIALGYINFDFSFLSLLILSGVCTYFYQKRATSKLRFIDFILVCVLLFSSNLTSARTGLIAFFSVVGTFSFLYILLKNKLNITLFKRLVLVFLIVFAGIFAMYLIWKTRGFGTSGRTQINIEGIKAFKLRPLVGYGLSWVAPSGVVPHNFFVQFLSQTGLVFSIPITLTLAILMYEVRQHNIALYLSLLIVFMGAMFIPDILNSRFLLILVVFGLMSGKSKTKSSNPKIVHLLSSGGYSGAETIAVNIIKSSPSCFESIYMSPTGPIASILSEQEIAYHPLTKAGYFSLRKSIKSLEADIIYAHDFKASVKAAFLFSGKPVVAHIHQNPDWFQSVNIRTILFLFSSFFINKIVFVSQETRDEFVFRNHIVKKTHVLENYIDAQEVLGKAGDKKEKYYDLAFLGRFETVKNPILFLEIIKEVKHRDSSLRAIMIGDGSLLGEVQQYIQSNNLTETVELKGYMSNPYQELIKSRLLITPSVWEGFGLSSAEAMILGLPVIASKVGGLKTIITEESGVLCTSPKEFVDAAIDLLKNPTKLNYYSGNAQNSVRRFTDIKRWETSIASILEM